MKNKFPLCCAVGLTLSLGIPFFSVAQSTFGLQAGLNFSGATVIGPTPYVATSQGNFFAGGNIRHRLSQRWTFGSDVQLTKRGFFFYPFYSNMADSRIGVQLLYLDIASRFECNFFKNISLEMGVYTGYRLIEYDQLNASDRWLKAAISITDQWDVGLQAGLAAHFQRWTAFVRYSHGLKPVGRIQLTDEDGNDQGVLKIINRGLQVGANYAFF